MYKAIIIHHNTEFITKLKSIISGKNLGFSVVSSYLYSKRAADAIARTHPNLVVTDLPETKEKEMDIVKYIHTRFPDMKIILYTDRKDFDLAKQAIAEGVSALINPDDEDAVLLSALTEIKKSLDRQQTQKKRDRLLERLVVSARKQFLTDIFMGNITGRESIQKKAAELSLGNHNCIYCPFWIVIPNYNEYMTTRWNYNKERFLIAVGNFLRPERLGFEIQNIMFTNGEIFYVALSETSDATNFINILRLHLTNAEHNLKTMIGLTVDWHIGRHFMSFHDFIEHITTPVLNGNFSINAAGDKIENHALLLDTYKNVVISAILDKTPRLKEHLNYIVRLLMQSAEGAASNILTEFCEICVQNMAPDLKDNAEFQRMMKSMANAGGATAQSICTNILVMACREAGKNVAAASSNSINRALEYIQNNFAKDLSLEDVAKYLNLNPSYFSRFFKSRTGYNFRDYLIDLRVKKAKELLLSGKYKIYEISNMTGYKNSKYFAAQFKAVTGMAPREFADAHSENSSVS